MKDRKLREALVKGGVLVGETCYYELLVSPGMSKVVEEVYQLRAELKALKELLGVETVTYKGKALKKGKKEVGY